MSAAPDWIIHYVTDHDDQSPTGVNCHTHGIADRHGHLDFQIVIPLPPEVAMAILNDLGDRARKGERFEAGMVSHEILRNMPVTFAYAVECWRRVVRVILPDPQGSVDRDTMDSKYAMQWDGTTP